MSDVVVKFPVRDGEEAQAFRRPTFELPGEPGQEAELWAGDSDAPYVMSTPIPWPTSR